MYEQMKLSFTKNVRKLQIDFLQEDFSSGVLQNTRLEELKLWDEQLGWWLLFPSADLLSSAADTSPQTAGCLGNGDPVGQVEALQRLPYTWKNSWFCWLTQVFQGNVVYSLELFAVVVPEVTELLGCCVRDNRSLGGRAGNHGDGGVTRTRPTFFWFSRTAFPPHSLRTGWSALGTMLDLIGLTESCFMFSVDLYFHYMPKYHWFSLHLLLLSLPANRLVFHSFCLPVHHQVLLL